LRFVDATQPLLSPVPVSNLRLVEFSETISNVNLFRDDVTVEVIFFGQSPDSRTVEVNQEATAPEEPAKSKL
jgi:hypothetical protein